MSAWPASLPQRPLLGPTTENPGDTRIRSEMAAGVAKVRSRYTARIVRLAAVYRMTNAQAATFDTFYATTLNNGVLSFTIPHPRTGDSVSVRIVDEPRYADVSKNALDVSLTLEVLP